MVLIGTMQEFEVLAEALARASWELPHRHAVADQLYRRVTAALLEKQFHDVAIPVDLPPQGALVSAG